ncbi:MAG: helix-turn-helix transcriptional regulator, partial [Kiritimatiellales bacterium]|nr:helix-turn-helix transcriptional regulator [Kiritimatiellales bacterium]
MSKHMNLDNANAKTEFLESITASNCGEKLTLARDAMAITRRELASIIGCSEATISRIEAGKTKPTIDFMNRLRALVLIGQSKFKSLSSKDKEKTIEFVSATSAAGAGFGAAMAAVSASGTVVGLSAAGVASGLSAIGGTILGGAVLV